MTSTSLRATNSKDFQAMASANHQTYQYGITFPPNVHGVGSPDDVLAFFDAVHLIDRHADTTYSVL